MNERLITRREGNEYVVYSEYVELDVFRGTFEEAGKFISDYLDEIDSY